MLVWLRKWWVKLWEGDVRDNAYELLLLAAVLLGFYLRINGWLGHRISFWFDEATWAQRLLHWPLRDLGIRPIGFMWVTRVMVRAFGATEVWFRLLPALGAIGSLLLLPYVVSRLVVSRVVRVLLVLLFALQPALIAYANEFKPYSVEVLTHLAASALYLRFQETKRLVWFYALLAYLPLGFLFSYNLAVAFPGLLLLCLYRAWHAPERRKLVLATLLSGVVCAGTAAGIYSFALKKVTRGDETEAHWGGKYQVFYRDDPDESRVTWTARNYNDMAAFVGLRRDLWADSKKISERAARELGSLERAMWVGLSFVGLYALWRQRRELLLVLFVPLLVMLLGNLLGKWPLGAFRTNLFTLVYTLPLIGLGIQQLTPTRQRLAGLCACVALLTLIPGFWFGFDWHGHKQVYTRDHYQRQILSKLHTYRKAQLDRYPKRDPLPLYLDPHTYSPYTFYLREHPDFKDKYGKFFTEHFTAKKVSTSSLKTSIAKRLRKNPEGVWSVVSSRGQLSAVLRAAQASGALVIQERIADEHVIMFLEAPKKQKRKKRKRSG